MIWELRAVRSERLRAHQKPRLLDKNRNPCLETGDHRLSHLNCPSASFTASGWVKWEWQDLQTQSPCSTQCLCSSSEKCCWNSPRDSNSLLQFQATPGYRWIHLFQLHSAARESLGWACASWPGWDLWVQWLCWVGDRDIPDWDVSPGMESSKEHSPVTASATPPQISCSWSTSPHLGSDGKCLIRKPFFSLIFFPILCTHFYLRGQNPWLANFNWVPSLWGSLPWLHCTKLLILDRSFSLFSSSKSQNMILLGKRNVPLKCQITARKYYGIVLAIALCDCSKTDFSF